MTGYRHGLVIGKFYPPHRGHHHLVRAAAAQSDRVTVVVMAARVESIPLPDRVAWMRAVHSDTSHVTVVGMPCDIPVDLDSEIVWAAQVINMVAATRQVTTDPVDAVFSSERYGDELAARLGATHVSVDPERITEPISGTAVRDDLVAGWDMLHPVVRAGLATRIVVLGAESTGTTTVSRLLAEHYRAKGSVWSRTGWVPEHGRDYTIEKWEAAKAAAAAAGLPEPTLDNLVWTTRDFRVVAARQTATENAAALSGSPVLICDTDAFATSVWEYRYVGPSSRGAQEAATTALPRRDIYLLTDHVGVPFVQDGLRDGEHIRAEMTGWFIDALTEAGHSWVLLTGSADDRVALAIRITDQMLAQRATFTAPLG